MVIPVLCLGLSLLSSTVNIISGGIMFGFVVVVIGKYTQRMVIPVLCWVCCCCHR